MSKSFHLSILPLRFPGFNTLFGLALVVALIAAVPLLFVLQNSAQLSVSQWQGLWSNRLPGLLWNTLSLAFIVAIGSLLLGISSAWLVVRRAFVGKRVAVWLMVLPLTIPTYVLAYIYTELLDDDGWLGRLWHGVFGASSTVPDLYSLGGVSFVLSLAGFSYLFLLVRAALLHSSASMEEAARIQGAGSWEIFWRINLPMLRPAIAAGLALVVLHVLSDFGAVSMLRYQTFTLSIYLQMSGRFDYQSAAALSLVLVLLSSAFLMLERRFRQRQRYYDSSAGQAKRLSVKPASVAEQIIIWLWLGTIVLLAFLLPLAWMLTWTWEAIVAQLIDQQFFVYVMNSFLVASAAATITLLVALPVALYHARNHSGLSQGLMHGSSIGFVLPGPVIALGVLVFVLDFSPILLGTLAVLVLAMTVRFLPLAVQSQDASLQQLTPALEQAGRVLGAGPLENLWRVILPVVRPGMVSAWVLVFIDTLKELPATLLLRPTGFDTLPVRIWIEASEEMLELAAPAALMLVVGTLPAIWIMMRTRAR